MRLEMKAQFVKEFKAAVSIQRRFRHWMRTKKMKLWMERRNLAALKIQKNYKTWHRWSLIPKALKFRKNQMATIIQKYMRGYRVYHQMYTELRQTKLQENFNFFKEMRQRVEVVAVNRIKLWFKIVYAIEVRRRQEDLKKQITSKSRKNTRKT